MRQFTYKERKLTLKKFPKIDDEIEETNESMHSLDENHWASNPPSPQKNLDSRNVSFTLKNGSSIDSTEKISKRAIKKRQSTFEALSIIEFAKRES